MSDENEYATLTFEKLLLKALDSREDTAPLLAEAQRRDFMAVSELTAVVGKTVGAEWTPVGAISIDDGVHQIACCIRLTPPPEPAPATLRSMQPVETTRGNGGSWRDSGRTPG